MNGSFSLAHMLVNIRLIIVAVLMLGTYGSTTGQDGAWTAPDWAKNTKNPIEPSPASLAQGQRIFQQNCWTCHGKLGQGDGPAGAGLPTKPANLSSNAIQSQSDGEIFWKITEGRGTMAPYKQGLSETQRWHLVNYIRNLSN